RCDGLDVYCTILGHPSLVDVEVAEEGFDFLWLVLVVSSPGPLLDLSSDCRV
ncbi:hypothetical protein Tco_0574555, partial [Tanacetum coccineum]